MRSTASERLRARPAGKEQPGAGHQVCINNRAVPARVQSQGEEPGEPYTGQERPARIHTISHNKKVIGWIIR